MSFSLFPAFLDHPAKIKFADQEEGEHIELFLRQHWVTNVPWIFTTTLLILFPVVVNKLSQFIDLIKNLQTPPEVLLSGWFLWYMLVAAYVIGKVLGWYFNIYIVTNTHLVDINFHNLLNRDVTEVRLDDIESAKAQIKGILGSLFNFGDLTIETAAERQQICFSLVPKPDFVKERIQDLQETQKGEGDAP